MTANRRLGRPVATVLIGLMITACSASVTPTGAASVVPASTRPASALPSAGPSASPPSHPTAAPSQAADPSAIPAPSDGVDPANPPEPRPTPAGTPIAGCGTGESGFAVHSGERPTSLHFGGATIEFASAGMGMRDGSWDVDDVIPAGIGLTPNEIAVVVGPDGHMILRATGLTLLDTSAAAVRWSDVAFDGGGLASLGGDRTALDWRVRSDGSLSVSAPTAIGDYAVEFMPHWQGSCVKGDGTAYSRIKVR